MAGRKKHSDFPLENAFRAFLVQRGFSSTTVTIYTLRIGQLFRADPIAFAQAPNLGAEAHQWSGDPIAQRAARRQALSAVHAWLVFVGKAPAEPEDPPPQGLIHRVAELIKAAKIRLDLKFLAAVTWRQLSQANRPGTEERCFLLPYREGKHILVPATELAQWIRGDERGEDLVFGGLSAVELKKALRPRGKRKV